MNYKILSLIILIGTLLIIFVLYEKSNTTLKEISMTATIAAVAGVLRVPFAALPNIQPTTFIVIISGYVFGPFFGFMVGACAAFVSNIFLGHGPWTPWQMFAWGIAGLSSGLLNKFINSNSRIILGIYGFIWGFLYDFILNLWYWLFFVYPLTLESFIALFSTSFFFDLMHALANFGFIFIFGKDLINLLSRYKDRISYIKTSN